MNVILIGVNGKDSMKAVLSKMTQPCVLLRRSASGLILKYDRATDKFRFLREPLYYNTLFKWGNYIREDDYIQADNPTKKINSVGVDIASNKKLCRMTLQEQGLSVPHTVDFEGLPDLQYPYIARPNKHHAGQNFNVINNRKEEIRFFNSINRDYSNWYFQSIINKIAEYRVHVAHGKVLAVNQKSLSSDDIRANQTVTEASWGNVTPWSEYNKDMCLLACSAVKAIGLDMGAVDVMFDGERYYIAEINTAPSITDEYISTRYAKYFDWVIQNPAAEHWDFTQYNLGKSFAWKNNQLNPTQTES